MELAVQDMRPDDFFGATGAVRRQPARRIACACHRAGGGGGPIDDAKEYTLATSDYLADGGSGHTLFQSLPMERTDVSVLDAFIAHLRNLPQPVVAPGDARVLTR